MKDNFLPIFGAPYVLLEDRLTPSASGLLYRDPIAIVECHHAHKVDDAFRQMEDGLSNGLHAAGLLSYELGYALEPRLASKMPPGQDFPLLWFGLFEAPQSIAAELLDEAFADLGPPAPISEVQAGHERAEHVDKARQVLELIAAGDVYQVNLTFPMRFHYAGDPLRLYGALRVRQPVAHGGVANLRGTSVLSVSPELWIDLVGHRATMRPMKGTAMRGETAAADALAASALASDPKQRAENLMIVDLLRNDLSRISEIGSVRVPHLFTVESYPSFHTLTSTVTAEVRSRISLRERFAALFPCGSIVGAPKIRAGEIIRSLEPKARGFYTGALGRIAPNWDMTFNVAIRTAVVSSSGDGQYGVGGGIVADSDPDGEYDEALLKARVLTELSRDFDLFETFRWSSVDGFVRLALHLDRLERSSAQLGFSLDRRSVESKLDAFHRLWSLQGGDRRVRVLLKRSGAASITHEAAAAQSSHRLRVRLSDFRLDPADPYLRHKTTRREVYDTAFAEAAAAGQDEVLFLNRRGQVAEASRHTFFAEIDGRLITPTLSCGVLPGVLRASLLAQGKAFEDALVLEDLRRARALFLGNSLRGLREMALV